MADLPRDRNLVLALLAVRERLVDPRALRQALMRGDDLGAALDDAAGLDPDDRDGLEALTDGHLAAHKGDPVLSLASLCSTSPFDSPGGDDSPVWLGATATAAPSPGVATLPDPGTGSRRRTIIAGRYLNLQVLDSGGQGEVLVGYDLEISRFVALKRIKGPLADLPGLQARFIREAELAGQLEHPGIVPVHGLVRDEAGRPYYAMRLVQGDNFREAIGRFHTEAKPDPATRSLGLRRLLERFRAACQAVAYAHGRGVVHGDLKPANLMLGRCGETFVIDWGLAKAGGPAADDSADGPLWLSEAPIADTLPGSPLGTLPYASPEQAAGASGCRSVASDVYGLGATLYHLLTNRAPVPVTGLTYEEALARIKAGDFARPRQLDAWIAPPLEAICLKALALEPGDRYASALALAEEIERWLADEPVGAYPDPPAVRLGRWARRHLPALAATGALLLTATIALGVGTLLIGQAKRESDTALNASLLALEKMLDRVQELADEPRSEKVRLQVAEDALAFGQTLPESRLAEPRLQRFLADLYNQVGQLDRQADRYDRARMNFAAADRILGGLEPNEAVLIDRAELLVEQADLERDHGQLDRAIAIGREALKVNEALGRQSPDRPMLARSRGRILYNLAGALTESGQPAEAIGLAQRAITDLEPAIRRDLPGSTDALQVALAHLELGLAQRAAGRPDAARQALDGVRRYAQPITEVPEESPEAPLRGDATLLIVLARAEQGRLGADDSDPARRREGLASLDEMLVQIERFAAEHPEGTCYQRMLAEARVDRARRRVALSDHAGAEADFQAAEAAMRAARERAPANLATQRLLALALAGRGRLDREGGGPEHHTNNARVLIEARELAEACASANSGSPAAQTLRQSIATDLADRPVAALAGPARRP